jgi:hypothetical protein
MSFGSSRTAGGMGRTLRAGWQESERAADDHQEDSRERIVACGQLK